MSDRGREEQNKKKREKKKGVRLAGKSDPVFCLIQGYPVGSRVRQEVSVV